MSSEEFSHNGYAFADEKAKIGWEIVQAVSRIAESLPPEGQPLDTQPITFNPEQKLRGLFAIFRSGTVIGTRQEDVLRVPNRTLKILDRLNIPYHIVTPKK